MFVHGYEIILDVYEWSIWCMLSINWNSTRGMIEKEKLKNGNWQVSQKNTTRKQHRGQYLGVLVRLDLV